VDSVVDLWGVEFFERSKGNNLYSTATANSTIDFATKVIEDSVVDSPPSRGHVPQVVSSPSPLKMKTRGTARILSPFADSRLYRNSMIHSLHQFPK
jgi:hypothetical protein